MSRRNEPPHFSPKRLALDVNDNPIVDAQGDPVLEANPSYIWTEVGEKAKHLDTKEMRMALMAHPLIGAETRPFEYHSMEEYGCTTCHSGNGRALVAKRAHGPVFDETYEPADLGKKPQFLEIDEEHDPLLARMYNNKPGHDLVFQTTPLFVGPLMTAKCMQCHQSTASEMQATLEKITDLEAKKKEQVALLEKGIEDDKSALAALTDLQARLKSEGYAKTIAWLQEQLGDFRLSSEQLDAYAGQLTFMQTNKENPDEAIVKQLDMLGKHSILAKEQMLAEIEPTLEMFDRAKAPLFVAGQDKQVVSKMRSQVDRLTVSYQRGQELFLSQACYACHRIAGFSRSSVGPELTTAGLSYPWFIKESIVWPQADLPSSTMPNFHLDHEELGDLMAFLMAQTGNRKVQSEVEHQIALNQWEAGEKMAWEKPVAPTQIHDLRAGMMIYATQGCAACHKLEGFESNLAVEDELWFKKLFPEQITGSKLAAVVEAHGKEIEAQFKQVRKNGILEEIELGYPGLLMGYYSNFKFAARKGNEDLLNKVLMGYIQAYGLGRDIAPALNWSGVYRDNAWLMGHFHNPNAYTAKSIMPVMPFDDTKFYTLNYMLHKLGEKNRDALQQVWKKDGFDPPAAYTALCSSCHGPNRQGNGLVSEWIYPIPKNLRDPVFLRSLTKERAIDSIWHGVSGTPMPPWGETIEGEPVLNYAQIVKLVDWLYQGLPPMPRQASEEEKWNYTPEMVVQEMEKERELLQPSHKPVDVATYFEVRPNPIPGPDKELYFIREQFYTPENLEEGREYYDVNCATCHGKDGGGTGLRSTSMVEAKPRMLTNLPWIRSRDDLRLLRSIKYGVAGTAMIPWGDQTTAAQRMELVMYIRELTRMQILRDDFEEVIYDVFDRRELELNEARIPNYEALEKLQTAYDQAVLEGAPLTMKKELAEKRAIDARYLEEIELLQQEREIYRTLGLQLIGKELPSPIIESYFEFLHERKGEPLAVIGYLDQVIADYQKQLDDLTQGLSDMEIVQNKRVQKVITEQRGYINLRTKLMMGVSNGKRLQEKQRDLYNALHDA